MADKWTIRSNNKGLYNGVKPLEEGDKKKRKKEQERRIIVASGRTQLKEKYFIQRPTPRTLLDATN